MLTSNTGASCLCDGQVATNHVLRCLGVFDNSCASRGYYYGTINILQDVTFAEYVFQFNSADWFVGLAKDATTNFQASSSTNTSPPQADTASSSPHPAA
jgi:hypothetical protein